MNESFPNVPIPVFENFDIWFEEKSVVLNMHESPIASFLLSSTSEADIKRLKILNYMNADFYIILFSVVDPKSFESIQTHWCKDIRNFDSKAKIFLMGTKVDLRDNVKIVNDLKSKGLSPVTFQQGTNLSRHLNTIGYFGIQHIFEI